MKYKLTLKQKLFCKYYLEERGNATEAVVKAGYNVSKKNGVPDRLLARNIASQNLTKLGILEFLQTQLERVGYNDVNINKQHLFLINQFADLSVKCKAIDLYYKKKGAYSAVKIEQGVTPELKQALDRLSKLLPD